MSRRARGRCAAAPSATNLNERRDNDMKISLILGLGAAMIVPQVTASEVPINGEALGRMEGILAFCAKVDAQSAAKYQERSKLFTRDQADKDVKAARASKEYQDAFDSISTELGKVRSEDAVKSCTAYLEGK
jgi:hypothetical protein